MNAEAPLCLSIVDSFINHGHLLECKNRHFLRPVTESSKSFFIEPKECQLQILYVFSPAWFSVRILKYKDVDTNEWTDYNLTDSVQEFHEKFNEFYANEFIPIQNSTDIHIDGLYVLRNGNKFSRCRIIAKKYNKHFQITHKNVF